MRPIRVLVIDSSVFFREELLGWLHKLLPIGSLLETAGDPMQAKEKYALFRPDVIAVNLALAALRVSGVPYLPQLTQLSKVPVIVYGILPEDKELLQKAGAADYVFKSRTAGAGNAFYEKLAQSLQRATEHRSPHIGTAAGHESTAGTVLRPGKILTRDTWKPSAPARKPPAPVPLPPKTASAKPKRMDLLPQPAAGSKTKLIAMGSSTGGTEALSVVLRALRPPLPGIVIVQHIPPNFSRLLAERLDSECVLHIKEGASGDQVVPNTVYIAPGGRHMTISSAMKLTCAPGPKVHSCCPSVDVLFDSVAKHIGGSAMGVILTGMGRDGAAGLLRMKRRGSSTIGQDEASCIVYGMPRAAWEIGAVDQQFPLDQIASAIMRIARN